MAVVDLISLADGTKFSTVDGSTAEVVNNPKDGVWVFAKYLTSPDNPSLEGTEEMFFAQDILEVLE